MHLLACSVLVLLFAQISVSVLNFTNTQGISCPNNCAGTYHDNVIQVSASLFPKCTLNIGKCNERPCDRTTKKQCIKRCYAKKVWAQVKCCRSFWVLKTKKCKCSPFPFVDPPKPDEGSISLALDNASNKTAVNNEQFCPPYNCEGALLDNEIQVAPGLLPECTYNQQRCRKQKCGEPKPHTKPCQLTCYPRKVWKEVKCCRTFWVLKIKKCRCGWKPWPIPKKKTLQDDALTG